MVTHDILEGNQQINEDEDYKDQDDKYENGLFPLLKKPEFLPGKKDPCYVLTAGNKKTMTKTRYYSCLRKNDATKLPVLLKGEAILE